MSAARSTKLPSAAVVAAVHASMIKERKGHTLDHLLSVAAREGFFSPGRVDKIRGFYFLDFRNPDGHACLRTAITADESFHSDLAGLMPS